MLPTLALNTASLAGIILVVFWVTNWMAQHIVIEVTNETPLSRSPLIGTLAVAAYFTVMLAAIVFFFQNFPTTIKMLLMLVFTIVTYRFFLFLFEIARHSATKLSTRLLAVTFGCTITALWTLYPNWLTINIAAALVAVTMLLLLQTIPLRTMTVVAVGVTIYDVVAVFSTGQMIAVAGAAKDLPMMLIIPQSFDLASTPAQMLGLGDIVIPGAIIMAALKKNIRNVYPFTLLGYFIGLTTAIGVVYLTRFPQPATIYLVPGVLFGLVWAAHRVGTLKETFAAEK
ncbi:MAG: presenilin family intramembrane aspartyl protease [bacterium]|nr:presenilin family intramembrane aspartyl protease [bacterium]